MGTMIQKTRNYTHRVVAVAALAILGGCASLSPPVARVDQFAPEISGDTELDQTIHSVLTSTPGESAAHFLQDPLDAFAARLAGADRASRSIDAQYYLYHDDVTGNLYTERLLSAAERGVQVRLLLDDMGIQGRDAFLLAMDAHPNINIRVFNPFANRKFRALEYFYRFGLVTRRMHNKSMVIDRVVAITGGRNIGDEYFDANPKSNFIDMDILVFGPAVEDVSAQFDDYWNSPLSYDIKILAKADQYPVDAPDQWLALHQYAAGQQDSIYIERLEQSRFFEHLREGTLPIHIGPAVVLVDKPQKVREPLDDQTSHLGPALWPFFRSSDDELVILNPYFIPGDAGVEVLADAVRRGCRVVVLTNSLAANDVAAVHGHYSKYRKPLIEAGVELYELKAQRPFLNAESQAQSDALSAMSLHVKTFVFDRQKTFIGSLNLDPRSVFQNTELGVIVEDPDIAAQIASLALDNLPAIAYRVQLDERGKLIWTGIDFQTNEEQLLRKEPDAGIWLRLFALISRILPVESQL